MKGGLRLSAPRGTNSGLVRRPYGGGPASLRSCTSRWKAANPGWGRQGPCQPHASRVLWTSGGTLICLDFWRLGVIPGVWERGCQSLVLLLGQQDAGPLQGRGLDSCPPPPPHPYPEQPCRHSQRRAESPPALGVIALRICSNHQWLLGCSGCWGRPPLCEAQPPDREPLSGPRPEGLLQQAAQTWPRGSSLPPAQSQPSAGHPLQAACQGSGSIISRDNPRGLGDVVS